MREGVFQGYGSVSQFHIPVVVMVAQIHTCVKIHRTLHPKKGNFTI